MDTPTLHTAEGGKQVNTDQGCSLCGGDCPVPAACERQDEAKQAEQPITLFRAACIAAKACWGR